MTAPAPAPGGGPKKITQWIETHKQEAGLGAAAAAVVGLAVFHKRQGAATAAAGAAVSDTSGTVATSGGIGVPGQSATDIQNAVQDQINDDISALHTQITQQIGAIPAGPRGATGAAGAPGKPGVAGKPSTSMYAVNQNRIKHKLAPLTQAQYQAQYSGPVQTAAQTKNITSHTPAVAAMYAVNENRLAHGATPLTQAQYQKAYSGGTVETAGQAQNIQRHTPAPAPKPKPKPVANRPVVGPKVVKR